MKFGLNSGQYCESVFKEGLSLSKKRVLFASMTAFKNDEKCFLFNLKNFFCSQGN